MNAETTEKHTSVTTGLLEVSGSNFMFTIGYDERESLNDITFDWP